MVATSTPLTAARYILATDMAANATHASFITASYRFVTKRAANPTFPREMVDNLTLADDVAADSTLTTNPAVPSTLTTGLPNELLFEIAPHLPLQDLIQLRRTAPRLPAAVNYDENRLIAPLMQDQYLRLQQRAQSLDFRGVEVVPALRAYSLWIDSLDMPLRKLKFAHSFASYYRIANPSSDWTWNELSTMVHFTHGDASSPTFRAPSRYLEHVRVLRDAAIEQAFWPAEEKFVEAPAWERWCRMLEFEASALGLPVLGEGFVYAWRKGLTLDSIRAARPRSSKNVQDEDLPVGRLLMMARELELVDIVPDF